VTQPPHFGEHFETPRRPESVNLLGHGEAEVVEVGLDLGVPEE
jgi:hypothetical protein